MVKNKSNLIWGIIFVICSCILGCVKTTNKTEDKLSAIYKNKLTAYKGTLAFKMGKLRKMSVHDTIIATSLFQKDRIEFLRMIVETNYYNLVLGNDAPAAGLKNTLRIDNYFVEIADPDYKYGRNKTRKYCDEDILHITKDFNEKYPPQKVPGTTEELYDYFFYKTEMLTYLLQNKCY
ncbi:MAG: hypothetical protein H7Y04_13760 [Verrucomicrobia bacterium]|nr:hypothetical protein [Cytophagales bacterium]